MRFEDFRAQAASIESLRRDFQSGQFVHAYLFVGSAGLGKRSLAGLCAQTLLCLAEAVARPCGHCAACQQVAHANHPDVFLLRPERSIGVDAVRALIADLQMRPFSAGRKAAIIEQADRMTVQAQNCLLRTLEEPPAGTVFFLLSEALGGLLPTIRSRCRILTLPPLQEEALCARLEALDIAPAQARMLSALADGSVGRALQMAQDEDCWQLRERVLGTLFSAQGLSAALRETASYKEERARAAQILDMTESALRAALRAKVLGEKPPDAAYPDGWRRFTARAPAEAMLKLLDINTACKKMIASNVSLQAALDTLVIGIAEEQSVWQW